MNINIQTINHSNQRYETVGDYWIDEKHNWQIRISNMNNWKYELLVAIHELIEFSLCTDREIKEEDISAFDVMFEGEGKKGLWKDEEPGFDYRSPYREEHIFATRIEKMIAEELNIHWDEYEKVVNEL